MLARRRPLSSLLCLLSFVAACRTSEPVEPQAPAAAEPAPKPSAATEATQADAAPPNDPLSSEPAEQQDPGPAPTPEPALVAPDGTVIKPCGDVPPGMACIPGGPFIRGSDEGNKNAQPAVECNDRSFFRREVLVCLFRASPTASTAAVSVHAVRILSEVDSLYMVARSGARKNENLINT